MPELSVQLAEKDITYNIIIKKGLIHSLADYLEKIDKNRKITLVTDENVNHYYGDLIVNQLEQAGFQLQRLVVPAGEPSKSITQLVQLYQAFIDFNLSRSDLIISLGGGVVGDLAGYAAASYLRGIPYIQIPTSLLAQVDSSVGGKVAIDLDQGKNLVGQFYHPKLVLIDPLVLDTLSPAHFSAGMAEVIKYGCIADPALFSQLQTYSGRSELMEDIETIIKQCCQIKAKIVEKDEKDQSLRLILNFGHTLGHAIEAYYHYDRYNHGQAVAIGMCAINQLAEKQGLSAPGSTQSIRQLVEHYQLPSQLTPTTDYKNILSFIQRDKKNVNGQLKLIILDQIGQARVIKSSPHFFDPLYTEQLDRYDLVLHPRPLAGELVVPPSKSLAHRSIIAAGLAQGTSRIKNIQLSDDIQASIAGMQALGSQISWQADPHRENRVILKIDGIADSIQNRPNTQPQSRERLIDARASGTSLRFLLPVSSLVDGPCRFIGHSQLAKRPLGLYEEIYQDQGLVFEKRPGPDLDLLIDGRLTAGSYQLAGNVSSQFISGLLFSLPLLEEDSTIQISPPIESIGYIELSLQVLEQFGVYCQFDLNKGLITIPGGQHFHAQDIEVEADYSQAAFFLGAAALGQPVCIKGLNPHSHQADKKIITILNDMGAHLEWTAEGIQAIQPQLQAHTVIDGSQIPDLVPLLAAVACLADGKTRIKQLKRLKYKESNRLAASQSELSKLGGKIKIEGESLMIEGVRQLAGGVELWSHEDHRIAMMLAIASSRCSEDVILRDAQAVSKSYPEFWQVFQELGGHIDDWHMG